MDEIILEEKDPSAVYNANQMKKLAVDPEELYTNQREDEDEIHLIMKTGKGYTFSLHEGGYVRPKILITRLDSLEEAIDKGEELTNNEYTVSKSVEVDRIEVDGTKVEDNSEEEL